MEDIIEALAKMDVTSLSDAMDRLGVPCGCLGIRPVQDGKSFCGRAFTVHYVPCGVKKGTVGDFLDEVKPGEVVVIDNAGRNYCTVWGDIMTTVASGKGIAGTVIDGVCRDLPGIKAVGYPVFSKGCYMVTGKDRVEVDQVNVPVSLSGVKVDPGDIVRADDTGVIVIPSSLAEEVLKRAKLIEETEQKIIAEVRKGSSLKDARAKLHYHTLQTKEG